MFDFLTDSIENALEIMDGLTEGELPTKRQAAKLIAAISEATGFSIEIIQALLDD